MVVLAIMVFDMALGFRKAERGRIAPNNLAELRENQTGVLDRLDLPDEVARRLMELGFLPGHLVTPALSAPGGEPRVYRVDGSEIALRRETAKRMILREEDAPMNLPDGLG